jgi:hypothetical protein
MEFTLTPKSPRTTIFLVVALVGSLIFVMTSGGKSKAAPAGRWPWPHRPPGPGQPGGPARTPHPGTAHGGRRHHVGDNPFLSTESAQRFQRRGLRQDETDGGRRSPQPVAITPARSAPAAAPRRRSRVSGVIDGERRLALIGSRYYAPGQMVGEWRLTFVGPREARLERRGETITLRVGS